MFVDMMLRNRGVVFVNSSSAGQNMGTARIIRIK